MQNDENQDIDNQPNDSHILPRQDESSDFAVEQHNALVVADDIEPPSGYDTSQSTADEPVVISSTQPNLATVPDAPTPNQPEPAKRKKLSRKRLAIIAAVGLVLLVAGGASAYQFWYQNPDKVIGDALSQSVSAETVSYKSTWDITAKNDSSPDANHIIVQLNGKHTQLAGEMTATATVPRDGDSATFSGAALYDKESNVYIKLTNLGDLVTLVSPGVGTIPLVQAFLGKYNEKWIKLTSGAQASNDGSTAVTSRCTQAVLNDLRNDDAMKNELADVYRSNRFIVVKEKLGSKNGNLGYVLDIDEAKTKSFDTALEGTSLYKKVDSCDKSIFKGSETESVSLSDDVKVTVWIDRWSHQLEGMNVDFNNDSTSAIVSVEPTFDAAISIETPEDAVSLEDFMSDVQKVQFDALTSQSPATNAILPVSTSINYSSTL